MASWNDLAHELNAWATEGREATLWWRDDDAATTTPALEQLLDLCMTHDIPLALAVIPKTADTQLAIRLETTPTIAILQHGSSHANHAPSDQKKAELGAHRSVEAIVSDIRHGHALMKQKFPLSLPVLVPPWNRICDEVIRALPNIGIKGLSTFQPRAGTPPHPLLCITNTHVDIIDWKHGRTFAGTATALNQLIAHLRARRVGQVDADEATGLLTHHLVHTDECWQFLAQLFTFTAGHPGAKWTAADDIFSQTVSRAAD